MTSLLFLIVLACFIRLRQENFYPLLYNWFPMTRRRFSPRPTPNTTGYLQRCFSGPLRAAFTRYSKCRPNLSCLIRWFSCLQKLLVLHEVEQKVMMIEKFSLLFCVTFFTWMRRAFDFKIMSWNFWCQWFWIQNFELLSTRVSFQNIFGFHQKERQKTSSAKFGHEQDGSR